MKKFMVVTEIEGHQSASFFDHMENARQYKMDAECGMGGYAEVYEYKEETGSECGGYEFLFS